MGLGLFESIEQLLREKMAEYDNEIDTADGSRFDRVVVQPVMDRLGPDPTDADARTVIIDRLQAFDPDIETELGSAVRDLLINPLNAILEPFRLIARTVLLRGSWENINQLTEEEADVKGEDLFVTRVQGEKSSGAIRLLFPTPRDVTISTVNIARGGGLNFIPSRTQTLSFTRMATQVQGSQYYMDIDLTAEKAGEEYNIAKGTINRIDGVSGLSGVIQSAPFSQGLPRQNNLEYKDAVETAIAVRNIVTERSLRTVLPANFPQIGTMVVVGRADPAMERDEVFGPRQISGIPLGVRGAISPSIAFAGSIHIGGFTDVWVSPASSGADIASSLDVRNIYDEGVLVYWANTGNITTGAPGTLVDDRGFFIETDKGYLPVAVPGDFVIVEGVFDGLTGEHAEFTVIAVAETELELSPAIPITTDRINISYEVRRRQASRINISIDTLIAEDADGTPQFNTVGNSLLPVPGRRLVADGVAVASRNIATANVPLPLFYLDNIEVLDPISGTPDGRVIPEADPIVFYIQDRISKNRVFIRAVFREPTAFATIYNALGDFGGTLGTTWLVTLAEDEVYLPAVLKTAAGAATPVDDADADAFTPWIKLPGVPYTEFYAPDCEGVRTPQVGDYLVAYDAIGGNVYQSFISVVNVGGDPEVYEVEDDIFPIAATFTAGITQGTKSLGMGTNDLGFYTFDFIAERQGSNRQEIGTPLATPGGQYVSQGWRLIPRLEGYSFSTLEEPILNLDERIDAPTGVINLSIPGTSLRLNVISTPFLARVQDFLDTDIERVVSEDILIRRMTPARVHLEFRYKPDPVTGAPDTVTASNALREAIADSPEGISAKDLSNVVEELGASEVTYPFFTTVENAGKSRNGKEGRGKLLSFRSGNGTILSADYVDAIQSLYRMAHHIGGNIVAIDETE